MSVAELQAEVKEYRLQLETVQAGLQTDPDNAELANLVTELEEVILLTEAAVDELQPKPAATKFSYPETPLSPSSNQKWSRENHPAFQPGYKRAGGQGGTETAAATEHTAPARDEPVTYKVNDAVLAKWKSGDRAFYPAKISSITGSSSKPVYLVTFKGYNNTETLFAHEIKPVAQHTGTKRKAEELGSGSASQNSAHAHPHQSSSTPLASPGFAGTTAATAGPASGVMISAAASVDPALASQARNHEPSRIGDGPIKPAKVAKKISSTKTLEAGKSKWQEFAGGKGKMGKMMKKTSMFKTGEGVNARGESNWFVIL